MIFVIMKIDLGCPELLTTSAIAKIDLDHLKSLTPEASLAPEAAG